MNLNKSTNPGREKQTYRYIIKAVIAAAIVWFIFAAAGRILGPIAVKQISDLTKAKVTAESVKLRLSGSVRIEKLLIRPEWEAKYNDAIFEADAVYVRFGWWSLLRLEPKVKEIRIKDFVFNALYDFDSGRWNLGGIRFSVRGGGAS